MLFYYNSSSSSFSGRMMINCFNVLLLLLLFIISTTTTNAWILQPRPLVLQQQQQQRVSSSSSLDVVKDPTASSSSSSSSSSEPAPLFVDQTTIHSDVQDYYGKELQTSADLKTNACCTPQGLPKHIQECISNLHPDTVKRYYGCGLCLPQYDLKDTSILDLGCGAGRDVYIASQLVGENGKVVGIDMTNEQLDAAKKYQDYHTNKFGFEKSNVAFHYGYLEKLNDMISDGTLEKNSFDVIISNCVINLCTDKAAVLKACNELLKPGGEMYFSDVYSNRRVPKTLQDNKLLWGECLSGALYWNDFHNLAKQVGFIDPRLVEDKPITIENAKVSQLIHDTGNGNLKFYSATYRLCKNTKFDYYCEDYGQAVQYKGTIPRYETKWLFDKHHMFETGKIVPVCSNTYYMLHDNPKLQSNFEFYGTMDTHYGIFDGCGTSIPYDTDDTTSSSSAGCC